MKKFWKLYLLLFFVLFIVVISCGIPNDQALSTLNSPLGLVVSTHVLNTTSFTFNCYNPEDGFSGYNVYIAANDASLSTALTTHITSDQFEDPKIVNTYILKTSCPGYHISLPKDLTAVSNCTTGITTVSFTITTSTSGYVPGPNEIVFSKMPNCSDFNTSYTYHLAVTAFNETSNIESGFSQLPPPDYYFSLAP